MDLQDGIVAETRWGQLWGANVRSPNELSLKKLHVDWKYQLKNKLLHLRIILDSQPSLQTVNLLQCKAIEASHDRPTPKLSTAYCCQVPMPNGSPLRSGLGKVPRWMLRRTPFPQTSDHNMPINNAFANDTTPLNWLSHYQYNKSVLKHIRNDTQLRKGPSQLHEQSACFGCLIASCHAVAGMTQTWWWFRAWVPRAKSHYLLLQKPLDHLWTQYKSTSNIAEPRCAGSWPGKYSSQSYRLTLMTCAQKFQKSSTPVAHQGIVFNHKTVAKHLLPEASQGQSPCCITAKNSGINCRLGMVKAIVPVDVTSHFSPKTYEKLMSWFQEFP